jgi:hypothetical protein
MKLFRSALFSITFLLSTSCLKAQISDYRDTANYTNGIEALKHTYYGVGARYMFMSTDNTSGLTDYYANGLATFLFVKTAPWRGFQIGAQESYSLNIASSDFTLKDPVTGQFSRYEIGQFDIDDPANKTSLFRLEELFLEYSYKKFNIKAGDFFINTPYINQQDGRLRPTFEQGVWLNWAPKPKFKVEGGWLTAIAPRSSMDWFTIENSIGVYPQGNTTLGKKAVYRNKQQSDGMGMIGVTVVPVKNLEVKVWELYVQNIFNTAMLQVEYYARKQGRVLIPFAGFQYHLQNKLGNGGNDSQALAYYEGHTKAQVVSGRLGLQYKTHSFTLNYSHITDDGRYLMPREWGRDPFYTFLAREKMEGVANTHAYMAFVNTQWPKARLRVGAGYGYYKLPDVKNVAFNKYGMPSYQQANLDINYAFAGALKNLRVQLLVAAKFNEGNTYGDLKYKFNKTDMVNVNLVLNYYITNAILAK